MPDRTLSVIVPTRGPSAKLTTLAEGLASTEADHAAMEVVLVVDGRDDAAFGIESLLPEDMRFVGLTKEKAGPAAARNLAIEHASGQWLLFFDDDARVDAGTVGGHLSHIERDPSASTAFLGRVDWPRELIDSPWRRLLEESSMLFFWHRMRTGQRYSYRHFWTSNLSVRRDHVVSVGGFDERFPSAMHEDIELGWRLEQAFGMQVQVDTSIHSLHDHPLDPQDYLVREHKSGLSAAAARTNNAAFHEATWGALDDPGRTLDTLERLFTVPAIDTLALLREWAVPGDRRPSADEIRSAYLAHLPLKRMTFLHGYLDRPFEDLWERLECAPPRETHANQDSADSEGARLCAPAS
jgi:hypothetical protein